MPIWFNPLLNVHDLESFAFQHIAEYLELKWVEVGTDHLIMSMPVTNKVRQPYGLLHGGISCVLAETIGSIASALVIDTTKYNCVGLEINANHVRGVREGLVYATCSPLHLGKSTHVWDIKIHNEDQKLICISRLTVAIIPVSNQNTT